MRVAKNLALFVAFAFPVVLAAGCTTPVPPTVTRSPASPLKADPAIFVEAGAERPRIVESLRQAGVRVAQSFGEADYILNVNVGRRRAPQACGGTSNVAYVLDGKAGHLMVIKGRGLTGTCTPNVFDDMSGKLATYFGN